MAGMSDDEVWQSLLGLDDDLLDPELPQTQVEEENAQLGVDTTALAGRAAALVGELAEEQRLAWQERARRRLADLQSKASASDDTQSLSRHEIFARLERLREGDERLGAAIKLAARKRRPEESTDEELRMLLAEMLALQAMETNSDPEP